jgi:hypothetical protein
MQTNSLRFYPCTILVVSITVLLNYQCAHKVFASELRRCAAPWDEQWRALVLDGRLGSGSSGGEVASRARALAKDLVRLNNNLGLDAAAKV